MRDKILKFKDKILELKDKILELNKLKIFWIRLCVVGIWIIALLNIIQFFSTDEFGTIPVYVKGTNISRTVPVYVKGGCVDVDQVYNRVNIQGSVDVDNTVHVRGSVMTW